MRRLERVSLLRLIQPAPKVSKGEEVLIGYVSHYFPHVKAGAVVIKSVPDYALIVGNPGRLIGWMCECGNKLENDENIILCNKCNTKIVLDKENFSIEDKKSDRQYNKRTEFSDIQEVTIINKSKENYSL